VTIAAALLEIKLDVELEERTTIASSLIRANTTGSTGINGLSTQYNMAVKILM
jgi:hypothetical protein